MISDNTRYSTDSPEEDFPGLGENPSLKALDRSPMTENGLPAPCWSALLNTMRLGLTQAAGLILGWHWARNQLYWGSEWTPEEWAD